MEERMYGDANTTPHAIGSVNVLRESITGLWESLYLRIHHRRYLRQVSLSVEGFPILPDGVTLLYTRTRQVYLEWSGIVRWPIEEFRNARVKDVLQVARSPSLRLDGNLRASITSDLPFADPKV